MMSERSDLDKKHKLGEESSPVKKKKKIVYNFKIGKN